MKYKLIIDYSFIRKRLFEKERELIKNINYLKFQIKRPKIINNDKLKIKKSKRKIAVKGFKTNTTD